jgi:hypothetical protein
MWPWAHAALGYVWYTLYLWARFGERPVGLPVVALGLGTQLPDLVDKTLAWYLHVLPYGRSLAHSLLTGTVILLAGAYLFRARGADRSAMAFTIGYASHFVGDAYEHVIEGSWPDLAFLVWPLLPIPGIESEVEGVLAHLRNIEGEPFFLFGLALTVIALGLWVRHGLPGLRALVGLVLPERESPEPGAD